MPLFDLASLPNSRIKPRPSRTTGGTQIVSIPATSVGLVDPANENRTDFLLKNLDPVETVYYGYVNTIDGVNTGMELKAGEGIEITDPRAIYVYNPAAGAVLVSFDEGEG